MPFIIVQMSRLPWTVPVGCEVAKSYGIRAGATGNLQLAKALESEPCCHSGRDWIAINDAAVAAVSAVGGTSAVPILNYLEEHVKGETTLRLAKEFIEDGINWKEGLPFTTGAERRLCALRQLGAETTVVLTP